MIVVGLVIAACGGGAGASAGSGGTKGPVRISVNPWTGSRANAAVIAYLLKEKLGYEVELKNLDEGVDWQGFETGELDAILEVWGHDAERKTYIDEKKVAQDAGQMGVKGTIGWYVPGWMAKDHPDITDWNNLNKYADLFKTSESGDKGQFLLGDPSYVSNDKALITNLGLNYQGRDWWQRGRPHRIAQAGDDAEDAAARLLLRSAMGLVAGAAEVRPVGSGSTCRRPMARTASTRRRTPDGANCEYPAYDLYKAVSTEVRREWRRRLRADQELQRGRTSIRAPWPSSSTTRA